jgi:hypothetical protein
MAVNDSNLEDALEDAINAQATDGGLIVEVQDGSKRTRMADPAQTVNALMRLRRARKAKARFVKPMGDV